MVKHGEESTGTAGVSHEAAGGLANAAYFRPRKQQITLRVDADVVAWFRQNHPRYQTLMNAVLRKEMVEALLQDRMDS